MSKSIIRVRELLITAFDNAKHYYLPILSFFAPTLIITLISSKISSSEGKFLLQFIDFIFVTPLITGASIYYVHGKLTNKVATVSKSLKTAGKKFFQLFLLTIMLIVSVIPALCLLIVPGIYLSIRWSFVFYAVMIEDRSAYKALGRSWALTKGNLWLILRATLFLFFVLFPQLLILAIPLASPIYEIPGLGELIGVIVGFLINPIVSTYYVLLFMTLLNRATGADNR